MSWTGCRERVERDRLGTPHPEWRSRSVIGSGQHEARAEEVGRLLAERGDARLRRASTKAMASLAASGKGAARRTAPSVAASTERRADDETHCRLLDRGRRARAGRPGGHRGNALGPPGSTIYAFDQAYKTIATPDVAARKRPRRTRSTSSPTAHRARRSRKPRPAIRATTAAAGRSSRRTGSRRSSRTRTLSLPPRARSSTRARASSAP